MSEETQYKYLRPWRGSNYRQFFYKDRKIRAETLYRETIGLEPRTPEEVARDYDVPVEAVYEAIHYCTHNEDLLRQRAGNGIGKHSETRIGQAALCSGGLQS